MIIIISIVIPCFNAQNTIRECLTSILNQTINNIEVIVVDDGSSDNTGQIIKEFVKTDKRVKCFFQQNKGVSSARNSGIKNSQGDYVAFVDADDVIHEKFLEVLLSNIIRYDADISVCMWTRVKEDMIYSSKEQLNIYNKSEFLESLLTSKNIKGYLCNKLFNLNTIKEKKININTEVHFMEDLLFCVDYSLNAVNKAVVTTNSLYYYRDVSDSVTNAGFSSKKETGIKSLEIICNKLEKNFPNNARLNELYYTQFIYFTISLLVRGVFEKKISIDSKKKLLEIVKSVHINKIAKKNVKLSALMIKADFNLYYFFWKIVQKD